MGEHKHNPTATAAKNGELPPKKKPKPLSVRLSQTPTLKPLPPKPPQKREPFRPKKKPNACNVPPSQTPIAKLSTQKTKPLRPSPSRPPIDAKQKHKLAHAPIVPKKFETPSLSAKPMPPKKKPSSLVPLVNKPR